MGWELEDVEKPFVAQLQGLGWTHIEGRPDDPTVTGRSTFAEVIQETVLRQQLRALNLHDGVPWLDDERLAEAVAAITRPKPAKLMEANQQVTELLLKGITVEGLSGWDGGRGQTIQFIDWDNPAANCFTVVNQYRVDCPPGYDSGKKFIIPDLVLLVNGIPLVVVECKSPSVPDRWPRRSINYAAIATSARSPLRLRTTKATRRYLPACNCWWLPASTRRGLVASVLGWRIMHSGKQWWAQTDRAVNRM